MIDRRGFLIGGKLVHSSSLGALEVVSPSTEEVVGTVAIADGLAVNDAVSAARDAFDGGPWRHLAASDRADVLRDLATRLRTRAEEIAELITMENGSPMASSRRVQTSHAIALLDEAARSVEEFTFEEERQSRLGEARVLYEPTGVVAAISAWNGPLYLALNKVAPALAAGCSVVLKPSPEAPFDAFLLAEVIAESDVPDGVFNLVTGDAATGELLATNPGVDIVAFTGSTATGRSIMRGCSEGIRRCLLELGGKSAAIVLDDVVVDDVIDTLTWGTTMGSGQVCFALSRVLVPTRRRQELIDALCDRIRALRVGDPYHESTDLGPVITERHRRRVEDYIAAGRAQGGTTVVGGARPNALARGWYVEPTVLVGVEPHHRVAQEEIFGPVVAVLEYGDDDDAIAVANGTPYGLGGAVFTSDRERGVLLARRVRCGPVGVNTYGVDRALPFGGFKQSGIGREGGVEGLRPYLESKTLLVR